MEYILATFNCGSIMEDLKIPSFVTIGELIGVFNELYGVGGQMLHAEPKGIILDKSKSLAEQGIGHGTKLTLS